MDPVNVITGLALMLGAIASDPWGRSKWAASAYLLGASLFIGGLLA